MTVPAWRDRPPEGPVIKRISGYAPARDIAAGHVRLTVASARPTSAADMAQARLFDEILQGEIAELKELVAGIEARWSDPHEQPCREELQQVYARIAEVRQLLDALRGRFPAG